jgi:hypothetical protein
MRRTRTRTLAMCVAAVAAACCVSCTGPGLCVHGENWIFKVGTDRQHGDVSLVPVPTTIDQLRAFPHVDRPADRSRIPPVEVTTWVVRDVTITSFQRSPDGDVHMVLADEHGHTIIAEATPPFCTPDESPWGRQIAKVRKEIDREIPMAGMGWRTWVVSMSGIGYLDYLHGQLGVAENGIEIHPVLSICFGRGCTLPDPRE